MAITAPEAPSLNFKAKSGFIVKRPIFRDDVEEETVEEEPIEEEPIEEEFVEEEPIEEELEGDDRWQEFDEEFIEEEPTVEEEIIEEEPVEEVIEEAPPAVEAREPTVIVQPADTGGRVGSALPSEAEMAAYANPDDRGRAILRHFEEEDRRMSEQRTTEVEARPKDDSIFNFNVPIDPPSGGLKWVILIAMLTVLGYTVVRQLAMGPSGGRVGEMTDSKRREIMSEVNSTKAQAATETQARLVSTARAAQAMKDASKATKAQSKAADESAELKKLMKERPAMARALREVQAAAELSEETKTPKGARVLSKVETTKDGRKHIEIRI